MPWGRVAAVGACTATIASSLAMVLPAQAASVQRHASRVRPSALRPRKPCRPIEAGKAAYVHSNAVLALHLHAAAPAPGHRGGRLDGDQELVTAFGHTQNLEAVESRQCFRQTSTVTHPQASPRHRCRRTTPMKSGPLTEWRMVGYLTIPSSTRSPRLHGWHLPPYARCSPFQASVQGPSDLSRY